MLMISSAATIEEAALLLRAQRASCLLVCSDLPSSSHAVLGANAGLESNQAGSSDEGPHAGSKKCTLLGIFTERDALKWMAAGCPADIPITTTMSDSPVSLQPSETVGMAIQKMAMGGYRHLPILSTEGIPTSIATVTGIVHYLVEHFPDTIYNLPPTPNSGPSEREGA
jgi:CBS domain-containing protein